jgi:hypothetical protein
VGKGCHANGEREGLQLIDLGANGGHVPLKKERARAHGILINSKIILKRNSKEDAFSTIGCIAREIKLMDQLQSTRLMIVALNMGDISENVTRRLFLLGRGSSLCDDDWTTLQ